MWTTSKNLILEEVRLLGVDDELRKQLKDVKTLIARNREKQEKLGAVLVRCASVLGQHRWRPITWLLG
jgi:hypothetical protein